MASAYGDTKWRRIVSALGIVALGGFGAYEALGDSLGALRNIGPGAFPLIVSVLLMASGLIILFEDAAPGGKGASWRVLAFVIASLLSFALLTPIIGSMPAIATSVFLAAYADGSLKIWQVAALAVLVAVFCAIVFVGLLNLPLPLFKW